MCTMSVIRLPGDAWRIAFNRDEALSRPAALPPHRFTIENRQVVFPIDPQSLGTWICVNESGLALGLLNLTRPTAKRTAGTVSRGRVIPSLCSATSVIEAVEMIEKQTLKEHSPFRLIAVDPFNLAEIGFDGARTAVRFHPSWDCEMFTSSGLGDQLVERPRKDLFEQLLSHHGLNAASQDLFHDHVWPDRRHLSVHMSRADARTVSQTVIEMDASRAVMRYSDGQIHREQAELTLLQTVRP